MKHILCTLFAAVLLLGGAVSANAQPIDSWSVSITSSFASWTGDATIYANGNNDLSWGPAGNANYDNRSGIVLSGSTVTFRDQSLPASYGTLTGGTISLDITLTPAGGSALSFTQTFDFGYLETPNWGMGYDDNIFYLTTSTPAWAAGQNLSYDGYEYYFSFFDSFVNLNEMFPEYVGLFMDDPTKTYYGWITPEGGAKDFYLSMQVNSGSLPTPEPGSILLMGAGLAGLAVCVRRRRK